jgi:SAM-dependent methyltransferase
MGSALTNGAGRQALEAGPLNRRVFGDFLRARGWRYVAIDRFKTAGTRESHAAPLIDHPVDLVDLAPLSDASFDLFLAQHVLEEIEDYERALDEIARVLRPGGLVAVEIPFDPQREVSRRHPADKFGNVWAFGADLPRVVARRFARTEVLNMEEAPYSGRLLLCVR